MRDRAEGMRIQVFIDADGRKRSVQAVLSDWKSVAACSDTELLRYLVQTAGYVLIDPAEIVYCQADGNYTHLHLSRGSSETISQNLGAIEEILEGNGFFRASRSYLLNLKYLIRVDRKSCTCQMEYPGANRTITIPAQKMRILESTFSL